MNVEKFKTLGRVRAAEVRDLSVILEMVGALAEHHGDVATVTREALARDILGPSPWVRILLAEMDGVCVGYAALCPLAKMQFGMRGMDLQHLYVSPDMRRTGVGRALLMASRELAEQLGCAYLSVGTHPDNTVAQMVYPAMGFDSLDTPGPRFRIRLDPAT